MVPKPIVTPIRSVWMPALGGGLVYVKDETLQPTHTFKDRLAYEMIRPSLEVLKKSWPKPEKQTFASISYGNTARAMGYYVHRLNLAAGYELARAIAFVPAGLAERTFGPDTHGHTVSGRAMLDQIAKTCRIIPIDLSQQVYRSADLEALARQHDAVLGEFVDITEGLDRPAYVGIIAEALEQQLTFVPDYVIVPFGAGILCNEIIDYVADRGLPTKVIPVSSGNPDTIAAMLYGPIWVDTEGLRTAGVGYSRHEPVDKTGRAREPYLVYHIPDEAIRNYLPDMRSVGISSEPSGASSFAFCHYLRHIDPEFQKTQSALVLIINTGNGLLNYI